MLLEHGFLGSAAARAQAEVTSRGELSNSCRGCRWRVQRKICTEWRSEGKNDDELAGNMSTGRSQDPAHNIPFFISSDSLVPAGKPLE